MKTLGKMPLLLVAALLSSLVGPVAWAASFTVNSTADAVDVSPGNGVCVTAAKTCTLRAAIMEANALPGGPHTIKLPADTYTLTIFGAGNDSAATGDLDILTDLNITASGGQAIVQGASGWDDGVFQIARSVTVTMTGLVIRNGNPSPALRGGGGIFNAGTLTLNQCRVENNSADAGGGGIFNTNASILTLINTTVEENQTAGSGGGILNIGSMTVKDGSRVSLNLATAGGGGIINGLVTSSGTVPGSLSLINSTVDGNQTAGSGGGIRALPGSKTTLNAVTVEGNEAGIFGGGIENGGTLTLTNKSRVYNNRSPQGAGISTSEQSNTTLSFVSVDGNAASQGYGGGIFNGGGTLTVKDGSRISNNTAALSGGGISGGGIVNTGKATLIDSTVDGNQSDANGGGILNFTTLILDRSTLSNNFAAGSGGGLFSFDAGQVTMTNSTFSGNIARVSGGGFANAAGTATLNNVTVAGNFVTVNAVNHGGGGIANQGTATLSLQNTILAGNVAGQGPDCWTPGTSLTSNGFNLIQNASACTIGGDPTGNIVGKNPNLGPLQDNGGPTFTHALLAGSPAMDTANPATPGSVGAACVTRDQRGAARPFAATATARPAVTWAPSRSTRTSSASPSSIPTPPRSRSASA